MNTKILYENHTSSVDVRTWDDGVINAGYQITLLGFGLCDTVKASFETENEAIEAATKRVIEELRSLATVPEYRDKAIYILVKIGE